MSEKPVHSRLRRLVDWINLTGTKKVHSLIDKVYKRKNLEIAWEKVKANRGSGGVDGQSLEAFEGQLDQQLDRLQRELKEDTYQPLPVRQHPIPKRDKPGEYRVLAAGARVMRTLGGGVARRRRIAHSKAWMCLCSRPARSAAC
jgi:RNA-directed DNA polymerase